MRPVLAVTLGALLISCGGGGGGSNDGGAGSGGGGGSGGSGGTTETGGSGGTANTGGTGGMKMPCDLQITDATGSNVGFDEFTNTGAQGSTKPAKDAAPQNQGFHAQMRMGTLTHALDLTVAGPTPTVGASYTMGSIDATLAAGQGALYFSTIDGVDNYTWEPGAGATLTVAAISPGLLTSYYNVTFKFDGFPLMPRGAATANKATGTFKMSGLCQGAITK
ncbi:MAG TPA: hypothetical protein VHJ20_10120 [Polyangia bacterium]|nr:hypothetical protein [Polyangia bacterium]